MKKDIETRTDIELLVNLFYERILADRQIGYLFQRIVEANEGLRLQTMYDFFENIILFTGRYEGHPMNLHQLRHAPTPLTAPDFDHCNELFVWSVDSLFMGKNASLAKQRASKISGIIQTEISNLKQKDID